MEFGSFCVQDATDGQFTSLVHHLIFQKHFLDDNNDNFINVKLQFTNRIVICDQS